VAHLVLHRAEGLRSTGQNARLHALAGSDPGDDGAAGRRDRGRALDERRERTGQRQSTPESLAVRTDRATDLPWPEIAA